MIFHYSHVGSVETSHILLSIIYDKDMMQTAVHSK